MHYASSPYGLFTCQRSYLYTVAGCTTWSVLAGRTTGGSMYLPAVSYRGLGPPILVGSDTLETIAGYAAGSAVSVAHVLLTVLILDGLTSVVNTFFARIF